MTTRRLRSDECYLQGEGVQVSSSLESRLLDINAGSNGFLVNKRLGVGEKATCNSLGKVKIGSVFSNMARLPDRVELHTEPISMEGFI